MYGYCPKCGKIYGTKDCIKWYKPCEHILKLLKEKYKINKEKKNENL